jgi:arsenite methyltransferase
MTETPSCSLTPEDLAERVERWRSLDRARRSAQATPTGAVVHYRLDSAVVESLLELIEAEAACCPSLSFDATVGLRIEAPEALRASVVSTFVGEPARSESPLEETGIGVDRAAVVEAVRNHYGAAARSVGSSCCQVPHLGAIGGGVYESNERAVLPESVLASSLGCANPVAVAELLEGETVLDLGSGGGVDVLLSTRKVGPEGKAYGLDITEEMLELARRNQADAGIANAEFLLGHIEAVPVPDASVDVVISNCVLGLSPAKEAVLAEAHRVLRPGGRLAVADVVADAEASPETQADVAAWVSCLAGCLTAEQYREALEKAGFVEISIEESHRVGDGFGSVIVHALKPTGTSSTDRLMTTG